MLQSNQKAMHDPIIDKTRKIATSLDSIMQRVASKRSSSRIEPKAPIQLFGSNLSGTLQIEFLMQDPDFSNHISSPRTHQIEQESKSNFKHEIVKKHIPMNNMMNTHTSKPKKLAEDYYHMKNLTKTGLAYKDLHKQIDIRLKNPELHYMSFDTIKRNCKANYTAFPIGPPLLLSHLTPNRTIREYERAVQIKGTRYKKFYHDAIEHVLHKS